MLLGNPSLEQIIGIAVALVVGITFHEFSHAFVADELGDHRPRALGRVSLNPTRHIEPMGALFFLIAAFGWGRPVPVNSAALRPGRIGLSYVAAAGPVANLVVALAVAVVFRVLDVAGVTTPFVMAMLTYVVLYNLVLGIFNLLPIPPLDGYNLALGVLPPRQAYQLSRYAQYGMLLLLGLVLLTWVMPGGGPIGWIFDAAAWGTNLLLGRTVLG